MSTRRGSPTQVAESIPFDNSVSGFSSDNVQDAVVEAKSDAVSLPRFSLNSAHNAGLSNGQLVGVTNLLNVPLVVPVKSKLAEITYYQGGGNNRDAEFLFYQNAQTAPNLFFTWNLPNTTTAVAEEITDFTSPTFNQGDLLLVYFNDIGSNPNDVSLVYFFQAIE